MIMKRNIIFSIFLVLSAFCITSCTEDESTLPDNNFQIAELGDFDESGYSVVSYAGNTLELDARVDNGYALNQLTFEWYLIDQAKGEGLQQNSTYEREHIGSGQHLSYEVNLAPGVYDVICEATADNGLTVFKKTTLKAVTYFTQGFYILKDLGNAQTDIDIYNDQVDGFTQNAIQATSGQSIQGHPLALSMSYQHCYVDEDTFTPSSFDMATVTTDEGGIYSYRISDLKCVMSRDNLLYTAMDESEKPYRIVSGYYMVFYLSNAGVRSQYMSWFRQTSGKYALPSGEGASQYAAYIGRSTAFWDQTAHSIVSCNYNGAYERFSNPALNVNGLTDYECIASGSNGASELGFFLLKNSNTGDYKLVLIRAVGVTLEVYEIRDITGTHLSQCKMFSCSAQASTLIYGSDGQQIYGYDIATGNEQTILAQSMSGSGDITYISDQTFNAMFNYFLIAHQNGSGYVLDFYRVVGGLPDGAPAFTLTGSGAVKSVHYTLNGFVTRSGIVPPYMD